MSALAAFLFMNLCGLCLGEDALTTVSGAYVTRSEEELKAYIELLQRNGEVVFEHGCAEGYEAVRKNNCIESCKSTTNASDVVEAWPMFADKDDCCQYKVVRNGQCPCLIQRDCIEQCNHTESIDSIFEDFDDCFRRF